MMMDLVEIVKDVLLNVLLVKMTHKIVLHALPWTKVEVPLLNVLVKLVISIIMELAKNVP